MTRETKVGLVVASSFVCLVGVVVASRLARKGEPPANELVTQADPPKDGKEPGKDTKPPPTPKPAPGKPSLSVPQESLAATSENSKKPNHANSSVEQANPPGLPALPAPPPVVQAETAPSSIESLFEQKNDKKGASNNGGRHSDPDEKVRELLAKAQQDADNHSKEAAALSSKSTPPPPEPRTLPMAATDPVVPASLKTSAPPVGVGTKEEQTRLPAPPALPNVVSLGQTEDGAKEGAKASPIEKALPKGAVGDHKPDQPTLPSPPPMPIDLTLPLPPAPPAAVPPAPKQETPAPNPALVNQSPKEEPTPAVSGFNVASVANGQNKENNPISIRKDGFTGQPTNPPAPLVVSKATSSQVKVTDNVFQVHICTAQDVSFESLSTSSYGSPMYAKALLQHNRDHPLDGASLIGENPRLQISQKVTIPSKEYLASRYAPLIASGTTSASTAAVPAISLDPPPNATLPKQVPGSTPRLPTPSTDVTKAYRVPAQGQMIIEIAQQTLGDRGRWSEIYRLNPTLRPEFPIPGGTEIRLPASAVSP